MAGCFGRIATGGMPQNQERKQDMLKAKLDTLDGLDENLHQFYEEKDGKFTLKVEGADDNTELKGALDKERTARKNLEKQLKEANDAKSKQEMEKAEKSNDIEAVKAQLIEAHNKEKEALTGDLNKYKGLYQQTAIDNTALDAITKEGGINELLMPVVKSHVRLSDDGQVQVVDAKGTLLVNKDGSNQTVGDFVQGLKENPTYAGAFQGSKHSGGGMPTGETAGGSQGEVSALDDIKAGLQAQMGK